MFCCFDFQAFGGGVHISFGEEIVRYTDHLFSNLRVLVYNWQGASPVPELSFLAAPYRGLTRAGEKIVQNNLQAHARKAAIFPPKESGGKPYLEASVEESIYYASCKL